MSPALNQIIIIFAAIIAGFMCRKAGILKEDGAAALSNLVVKVVLPCYLFSAIVSSDAGVNNSEMFIAIGLSVLFFVICGLAAVVTVKLLKAPKNDAGVYMFEILCSNATYMGIPVCAAALGSSAEFYASIMCIIYNLICFSLGVFLLAGKASWKRMINPPFLAGALATVLYALKVPVPGIVTSAASFIGQATSPCAMLVIGSVLASVPLRDMFSEWRAIPYIVIRLFGLAALIWLLVKPLNVDPVLKGMLVLIAAMPAATNSTMLCTIYGGNRALSAKLIFLSTALSAFTIPLWTSFLT